MDKNKFRYLALMISISAHAIAYWQSNLMDNVLVHDYFVYQNNFLLIFSSIFTILLIFIKKKVTIWIIFIIKTVIFVLISISFSGYFEITFTLFISLVIEKYVYNSIVQSSIYCLLLLIVAIKCHYNNLTAFNISLPNTPLSELLIFGFYSIIFIILNIIFSYRRDNKIPIVESNRRINEATYELARINIDLQNHLIETENQTAKQERKKIARNIHDILAYSLTNIIMLTEAGIDIAEKNSLISQFEQIRGQAKGCLTEVRRVLKIIRSPLETNERGLLAIKHLVDLFQEATNIEILLRIGNISLCFNNELDNTLYRLIQEGLTNAIRHGKATKINIILSQINTWLYIYIEDNGIGCENVDIGYGLLGMKERLESLGGILECMSEPGIGYTLKVSIPLKEMKQSEKNKDLIS